MLQLQNKLSIILLSVFFCSLAQAAPAKMTEAKANFYRSYASTPINIVGLYQKHDKQFVYLKVNGAKGLVKVNKKYLLNSPSFLTDGEKVSVNLPIGRHVIDNKELLKASSKSKKF